MVTIQIQGDRLELEVEGLDKLWSLRSRLSIPLAHVRGIQREPGAARRWFDGLKLAGSAIPGVLTAGTFYQDGGLVFWDVHDPENAVAIDLHDERYQRLVIQVEDPDATIARVREKLRPPAA